MKPTADQMLKLPKWAQEYIVSLERQRIEAVSALNKWTDEQTPSAMFADEFTSDGEKHGPTIRKRYIQGRSFIIEWEGVWLRIHLADRLDNQRDAGIDLQWGAGKSLSGACAAALIPRHYQHAAIVAKENMR